jgi:hypothetical protein
MDFHNQTPSRPEKSLITVKMKKAQGEAELLPCAFYGYPKMTLSETPQWRPQWVVQSLGADRRIEG